MNKELIKERFSRKLKSYNNQAKIQRQMAQKLIKKIDCNLIQEREISVLEIGCGTGLLTELAVKDLKFKNYTALDIVPDCEKYIRKISSGIEFLSCDIEEYVDSSNEKFDIIISNASLQWVENLPEVIKKLIQKLNPEGKLVFSTFGKENFREIYLVLGKTLPYFSKNELNEKLLQFNPIIEEEVRIMAFKTPKEVLKHIQETGVNAISKESWTKKNLIDFEKEYNLLCANHPTLTYNPIYVLINK